MNADAPSSPTAPRNPRCIAVETELGTYALGALEPEERRAVAAHLAGCAACRAALARHERSVEALARSFSPVAPPPSLGRRLLTEIAQDATPTPQPVSPAKGSVPVRSAGEHRRWRWATVGLGVTSAGLAAVAALLLVSLTVALMLLRQSQEARDGALGDRHELAEYLSDGGTMTPLVPAGGATLAGGRGSLIIAPNQPRAALVVTGLTVGDGRRYRVWVERDGQRTWLDDLETAADGSGYAILSAPAPLAAYDTVGIALETPGHAPRDLYLAPIRSGVGP